MKAKSSFIISALCVGLTLTLASCGGSSEKASDNSTTDSDAAVEQAFTTPALQVCQLQGHVKEMKMTIKFNEYSTRSFIFTFDNDGKIQSAKCNAQAAADLIPMKFTTTDQGAFATLSYSTTIDEIFPDESTYDFQYSETGSLSAIKYVYSVWESSGEGKYAIDSMNDNQWFQSVTRTDNWLCEGEEGTDNYTFAITYQSTDDQGNWTSAQWKSKDNTWEVTREIKYSDTSE